MVGWTEVGKQRQADLVRAAARQRQVLEARRARKARSTGGKETRMLMSGNSSRRMLGSRRTPTIAELEATSLFKGLSRKDLAIVARRADPISLPAGTLISDEMMSAPLQFVVITDGVAEQTLGGNRIGVLAPGDHFGSETLLEGITETPTIVTLTELHGFVMARREFHSVLREVPALAVRLTASLARRLTDAERRLADVSTVKVVRKIRLDDPAERVAG